MAENPSLAESENVKFFLPSSSSDQDDEEERKRSQNDAKKDYLIVRLPCFALENQLIAFIRSRAKPSNLKPKCQKFLRKKAKLAPKYLLH